VVADRPRDARVSLLCLLLAAASGCDDAPGTADAGGDVSPRRPATPAPAPAGLGEPSRPVFSLDTAQREHRFPIAGDAAHVLIATLVDAQGRRDLRYARVDGAEAVSLAAGDWILPPTGAVVMGGATAVCWNVLTGAPSRYTAGAVPEPAQGMLLLCRVGAGARWGAAVSLDAPTTGVWVERVIGRQDGAFSVQYLGDDGWLAAPARPGHGTYEAILRGGRFEAPRLVVPGGDGT
jgi:hypothetical protein